MKKTFSALYAALISAIFLVPTTTFAQTTGVTKVTSGLNDVGNIVNTLTRSVVTSLATLFATLAMVAFFFGIVQFIWGSREGDATKAKNGKNFMLWGLVALFVMFSVWGIITYVQQIFGITQTTISIPTIQIGGSTTGTQPGTPGLPDGTPYYRCNGIEYPSQAAATAAGCTVGGGSGSTGGSTTNGPCDGIASETQRTACLNQQGGGSTGQAGPCDGIVSETQRNNCLSQQGGGSTNTSSCAGREGQSCTLPSGSTGTCSQNEEGTVGCYTISCGVGQVPSANGGCITPTGGE